MKTPSVAMLDKLWRQASILKWGDKCQVCGSTQINVHHIYSRKNRSVRWSLNNACILCPKHHVFDNRFSAHGAPAAFYSWLRDQRGEIWFKELKQEATKITKFTKSDLSRIREELSNYLT